MSYSKYNNKKTMVKNILFDSQKEGLFYLTLLSDKTIKNLKLQPKFELQPGFTDSEGKKHRPIYYVADFVYQDEIGYYHVIDVKGMKTEMYKLKKKLFLYKYPTLKLKEV